MIKTIEVEKLLGYLTFKGIIKELQYDEVLKAIEISSVKEGKSDLEERQDAASIYQQSVPDRKESK